MQIDPSNVTALAVVVAFIAGLVSFLSPCVLPLVPAYIGYLSGAAVTPEGVIVNRRDTLLHATGFVLGFSAVFVILGASVALVGYFLQDSISILVRSGAVLLVIFGLRVAGVRLDLIRWAVVAVVVGLATYWMSLGDSLPRAMTAAMIVIAVLAVADLPLAVRWGLGLLAGVLNFASSTTFLAPRVIESALIVGIVALVSQTDLFFTEKRFETGHNQPGQGYWTSMLMGAIFGAGWTPCVGPNLAAIFALAGASQTVGIGAVLLAIYSAGLAVPFLLVGAAFGAVASALRRLNRYLPTIAMANGVLLIFMGILLVSDRLAFLASYGTFLNFGI
jgi:cytochrome c-type biogenesis protein